MYQKFYDFTGMPFQLTPDSRFFFGSKGHSRVQVSESVWSFGAAVIAARQAGILITGGGHAMAAWFSLQE